MDKLEQEVDDILSLNDTVIQSGLVNPVIASLNFNHDHNLQN